MTSRAFRQIDVFGSGPFTGNPVAVVLGADDLDTEAMKRISAWTNLSECTFVLEPTDPAADYRVRIFSLTTELPQCHTIGIGAGSGTAGQVLVLHDMLGVNLGKMPKFVHNFMQDAGSVKGAMEAYVHAVKTGAFPDDQLHGW